MFKNLQRFIFFTHDPFEWEVLLYNILGMFFNKWKELLRENSVTNIRIVEEAVLKRWSMAEMASELGLKAGAKNMGG